MVLETTTDPNSDSVGQKRKQSDGIEAPPSKRQKEDTPVVDTSSKKPSNFKELAEQTGRKFPEHKVTVGTIQHRAHPFTIKVSFLSPQTQDMDLVDALRPKCGAIVHSKVMRDKHSHKSKGWGLVQFEERESVETALSLSDVLGIQGKSVIIARVAISLAKAHANRAI